MKKFITTTLVLALTACGGGGDSESPIIPVTPPTPTLPESPTVPVTPPITINDVKNINTNGATGLFITNLLDGSDSTNLKSSFASFTSSSVAVNNAINIDFDINSLYKILDDGTIEKINISDGNSQDIEGLTPLSIRDIDGEYLMVWLSLNDNTAVPFLVKKLTGKAYNLSSLNNGITYTSFDNAKAKIEEYNNNAQFFSTPDFIFSYGNIKVTDDTDSFNGFYRINKPLSDDNEIALESFRPLHTPLITSSTDWSTNGEIITYKSESLALYAYDMNTNQEHLIVSDDNNQLLKDQYHSNGKIYMVKTDSKECSLNEVLIENLEVKVNYEFTINNSAVCFGVVLNQDNRKAINHGAKEIYTSTNDTGSVFVIDVENEEFEIIGENAINRIIIDDDKLYYLSHDSEGKTDFTTYNFISRQTNKTVVNSQYELESIESVINGDIFVSGLDLTNRTIFKGVLSGDGDVDVAFSTLKFSLPDFVQLESIKANDFIYIDGKSGDWSKDNIVINDAIGDQESLDSDLISYSEFSDNNKYYGQVEFTGNLIVEDRTIAITDVDHVLVASAIIDYKMFFLVELSNGDILDSRTYMNGLIDNVYEFKVDNPNDNISITNVKLGYFKEALDTNLQQIFFYVLIDSM